MWAQAALRKRCDPVYLFRSAMTDGRKIIHIDMDAFFASVEQRDDPALRGRPVAVGHAGGRGVVAAASYEARKFGVRSAMPSVTAMRNCPELVFVPARFEAYRTVSRQIRTIFADYTDLIEPLSLDEAYLDVTSNKRGIATATEIAREIRARIFEETQLTASAGVSYNKFIAKLASDYRKPDGMTVITPARGAAFVAALPVKRFHGVGPKTAARMETLGIVTGADLAAQTLEFLQTRFGKAGDYYFNAAQGQDHREVTPDRPRKSYGSETTFAVDLVREADILAALEPLADGVAGYLQRGGIPARTLTLKVRYADFRTATRSRTVADRYRDRAGIDIGMRELVAGLMPLEQGVRLLGLALSNFEGDVEAATPPQLTLGL